MLANLKEVDVRSSLLEDSPQDADIVQEAEAPIVIDNRESLANKWRGSAKRKSYTVEFKKKTLDVLDSLKSSGNKYNSLKIRLTIQKFHKNFRKALKRQRRRNRSTIDPKYGRWTPENRYNVDQVPLPFVVHQRTTYDTTGNKCGFHNLHLVWIKGKQPCNFV